MDNHPGGLTRDHVVWAYRILLDRDPENEDVIGPKLAGSADTRELRHHLMTSAEFQDRNRDYAHTNDRTIVIKELDGPGSARLFVDLSDHVIGLSIVRGHYEAAEIAFVKRLLREGDGAIDVGAHIGVFSMHMAAQVGASGRVYAFEPFPANADLLERSIAENGFADRVVFQRAAVSSASGTAVLTFPQETLNSGGAYLLRQGTTPVGGNLVAPVPVVALDDLGIRRQIRFIKMDVEGAEPLVMRGARRLLREQKPTILSELHPTQLDRASGTTVTGFLDEMRQIGYRAHYLDGGEIGAPLEHAPAEALISIVLVPDTA
ncbi:MAG TPA: FkbM family methyltransferase [Vicinamibacterales bacterium]|jgi:FkbM family methyltransferase